MRVLVTGSSGFIGGHVVRLLARSAHDVVGFDRAPPGPVARSAPETVRMITGDVTNPLDVYRAIASVDPERIIHLAAILVPASRRDPRGAFDVNVGGTINVLEAAADLNVSRVVAGSSVTVYGSGPPGSTVISEATQRDPTSTYALTKYATEAIGDTYDVEFTALQTVHGFGPDRIRGNAYDAAVVKAAVAGVAITIPRTEIRDEFLYVEDSARAFIATATADSVSYPEYLVGTDERASLSEIAALVTDHLPNAQITITDDHPQGTWIEDRNNHPPTDSTRIQRDIGWAPRYSLPEMVEAYIGWLRENPGEWSIAEPDLPWAAST